MILLSDIKPHNPLHSIINITTLMTNLIKASTPTLDQNPEPKLFNHLSKRKQESWLLRRGISECCYCYKFVLWVHM